MVHMILADTILILHLIFIVFVIVGGFMVVRWHKLIWLHIPIMLWGVIVEWGNFICPLTPLENYFRNLAGMSTYNHGFIEEYIYPLIYLENLTRALQIKIGILVIIINIIAYTIVVSKRIKRNQT